MQPTKLTPERVAAIVRAKAAGETHAVAAAAGGVPDRTMRVWLHNGETGGREPYASFAKAFRRAEAAARRKIVAAAARAMEGALDAA